MNTFIRRKAAARPLGIRALRRQTTPSVREQRRIIQSLKDDANRQIRKSLAMRADEENPLD